jgi:hypothetical protein
VVRHRGGGIDRSTTFIITSRFVPSATAAAMVGKFVRDSSAISPEQYVMRQRQLGRAGVQKAVTCIVVLLES